MKKQFLLLVIVAGLMSIMAVESNQPEVKPWPVPDEFKNAVNPFEANAESLQIGKAQYNKLCASCHGKTGLGDGPKSRILDTFSGDFSGAYYQDQTDGEHHYKTAVGREEMPAYKAKMTDEDIWHTVNYMRTFKK